MCADAMQDCTAVSYTHLDVYKRQEQVRSVKWQIPVNLVSGNLMVTFDSVFAAGIHKNSSTDNVCVQENLRVCLLYTSITVENIIDGLYLKCVHQPASMVKRQALQLILEEGKVMTAQRIYRRLQTLHLPENKMQELRREFTQDDHGKWYENHPNSPQM